MTDNELRDMLIEYMGKGFLENIIDMFKHEPSLFKFLPDLIRSDNTRVRIGAAALVEELRESHKKEIEPIIPELVKLLNEADQTLRGDIAYILGLTGSPLAVEPLKKLSEDASPDVRKVAQEALAELSRDEDFEKIK